MKIIVVTSDKRIREIDEVEFYDYNAQTKVLRYFKDYDFYTIRKVEIIHCEKEK